MKCNSCGDNISPKMKKAIENNLCPFCGDKIVPDELKKSLSDLDQIIDFLFIKFKSESLDYLKDKYNLVERGSQKFEHKTNDDLDSDSSKSEKDQSLVEKLKDKNFRKNYIAANKIKSSTDEYSQSISPPSEEDDTPESYPEEKDENDDIMRRIQAMASKNKSGNSKESDLDKLHNLVNRSKRPFSPPH